MAIYIDVSSENLNPKSVTRFVRALQNDRPAEDVLLRVSQRVYKAACLAGRSRGVKVSASELQKLNQVLGKPLKRDDFVLRKSIKCRKCSRSLNFYDFFESGRGVHGDAHLAKFLSAGAYHVHIQKRGQKFAITCTECGTKNVISRVGYDGPDY